MGEIAEAMISGELCVSCGAVFEIEFEPFGVPVMCHDCHSERAKRCEHAVDGAMCEIFYSSISEEE